MTTPALQVCDVDVSFGATDVVHAASFAVRPGERFGLAGPNGAGKTTLLRAVAGLVAPRGGRVLLHGDDITSLDAQARVRRGLVLVQGGAALFGELTVSENLDVAAWTLRGDAARASAARERALEAFPLLRARLAQRAASLSGGEQHQLAIAKALAAAPRVLLVDELSLGLSDAMRGTVSSLVRSLRADGVSVVLVDSDASLVRRLCHRVARISRGVVSPPRARRRRAAAAAGART